MTISRRCLMKTSAMAGALLAAPSVRRANAALPLRFVPQADLTVLDPIWTTATITTTHALMVFDTLYGLDKDYLPSPQMLAGHRIEDDGLTWIMTLREGLLFHNGEKVSARDAVASIRRWAMRDLFGQEVAAVTNEIIAADDRTIVFRLKRPFPMLPFALGKVTPSMCAIMPEHLAMTDASHQITEMIGSGPFRYLPDERVVGAHVAYARFENYLPTPAGISSRTAGPKLAHFDRVEWQVIPDQATAAAALQAGEVDWLDTTSSDLMPLFKRNPKLRASYTEDRQAQILRFNQLCPPFDNPAIRRALLGAVNQTDFMTAAYGDDSSAWKVNTGFFLSGTPMASDVGMDALTRPRDFDQVKREIIAAGYKGERVVMLEPEDFPTLKAMTEVATDMLHQVGMNVETQPMDWGTLVQRRASREPVDHGGWNVFITGTSTTLDPSGHLGLRGNGSKAWFGWPNAPKLEALRSQWLSATDQAAQKSICATMQLQAFEDVPYLPLGESSRVTACRKELTGFPAGAIAFYGVQRNEA